MKNMICIFALCAFVGLMSCNQSKEVNDMFQHAEKIMAQRPDSVLTLLSTVKEANKLSEKDKAMYYLLLTEAENKSYIKTSSDSLITISTEYYDQTDDYNRRAKAWYYRGRINQDLGDAPRAQDYYLNALQNEDEISDHALLGRLYNGIGMLYTNQDVYEMAIAYQKKAFDCFDFLNDSVGKSFVLRDMSRIYSSLGKKDSAIHYCEKAMLFVDDKGKLSICRELVGLYVDVNDYIKANYYVQFSLNYQCNESLRYPTYLTAGKFYLKIGKLDSAYYYLNISKQSPVLATEAGAYFHLAKMEYDQGRWRECAENQMLYELLRDSISNLKQTESIRKTQSLYNYRRTESKLIQTTLSFNKMKIRSLTIGVVSLIVILVLATVSLIYYSQLKERRKRIREQREKLVALLRKQQEDHNRIEENERNITELEKRLQETSVAFNEKEKELMSLRKLRLEIETENLKNAETGSRLLIEKFRTSDIYYRFHRRAEWKPKEEDWDQLYKSLDETYDNFTHRLMALAVTMANTELRISCLIKANVPPATISMLLVTTPTSVSMIRKRLYDKLFTDKGTSEKFDRFIHDF